MNHENIIRKIQESDFFRAIERKESQEILDRRHQAAEALRRIDGATAEAIIDLQAKIDETQVELSEASAKAEASRSRLAELTAEKFGISTSADARKSAHISYLSETADSRLDEAREFFAEKFDGFRRLGINIERHVGRTDPLTMTKPIVFRSNKRAIDGALAYCLEALRRIEALRLEPVLDEQELAGLYRGMPDPKIETQTEGRSAPRKDLADIPLWAQINDDTHDHEISRLFERAKELLKRRSTR